MAVYKRDVLDIDLESGNIYRSFLNHAIGYKDQKADHFGVRVFRNGEAVNLTGISVQGVFMPPQGSPIAITSGNIVSGNVAEVVLPQACYNYNGQFTLAIKLVDSSNSVTGTVRIVDGVVDNTHASGTVAPTSAVPTYQEVLSTYEQAIAAINKTVRFDAAQSLTETQKAQARANIDAVSSATANELAMEIGAIVESVDNNSYIDLGNKWMTFRRGYYSTPAAGSASSYNSSSDYVYALAACQPGDVLKAHTYGSSSVYAWAFLDSSLNVLSRGGTGNFEGTQTAPASTAFALVNNKISSMGSGYYAYVGGEAIQDQVTSLKSALTFDEYLINDGTYTIKVSDLESGQWYNGGKIVAPTRACNKNLFPVRTGMTISYSNTTFDTYFAVMETPTSASYIQTIGWKTDGSGTVSITKDGYLVFIIRNHSNTSANVDPSDYNSTVVIKTEIRKALNNTNDLIYAGRNTSANIPKVLTFFDTSSMETVSVGDLPRNSYAFVLSTQTFTEAPSGFSSNFALYRINANGAGNLSVVLIFDRENTGVIYEAIYSDSTGNLSAWTKIATDKGIGEITEWINGHEKRTYNLLDIHNLITINSYISTTGTPTLTHSSAAVKTLAIPVEAGKTYTFSRKNAGSRLAAGCGTALWNDDNNHELLNGVASSDYKTVTITVPETGTYLYVFYYRGASDADYDATIEEAMITEGSDALPYLPYKILDVQSANLSESIRQDIQKGVIAYNNSGSIDRWGTRNMIFGVEFNLSQTTPEGTRIANAYGMNQSDFNNIYPWCDMKRCNVTIANGKKTITYEGDTGFATDGSNGNVFVEIPAFYVCREQTGGKERWLISGTKKGGFELHPWFMNGDGTQADFRYYGAYKACNAGNGIFSASGQRPYVNSGSGVTVETFPALLNGTGFGRNNVYAMSAIQYLFTIEYATRNAQSIYNGSTYNPYWSDYQTADFEKVLAISNNQLKMAKGNQYSGNSFAFYSVGMQVYIGTDQTSGIVRTITAITTDTDYVYITVDGDEITLTEGLRCAGIPQTTGKTDSLTTASGYASGQDSHVANFRYRGIENPWGMVWELCDGLKLKNGVYYVTDPTHYRESELTNWDALAYEAPMISATDHDANNWIKEMGFDDEYRALALPKTLFTDNGRSITLKTDDGVTVATDIVLRGEKYYCDAYYSTTDTSIMLRPAIGGGWDHHENAGLFCLRFVSGSNLNWLYGERITC